MRRFHKMFKCTYSLILVALHKESSLHPPSKLLYRSLVTTDLLVGLVAQPLYATYWMSSVQEHWSLLTQPTSRALHCF